MGATYQGAWPDSPRWSIAARPEWRSRFACSGSLLAHVAVRVLLSLGNHLKFPAAQDRDDNGIRHVKCILAVLCAHGEVMMNSRVSAQSRMT